MWDAVKKRYLDVSNFSQVYELIKKSFQSRQDGYPLAKYYNELNLIFMKLDNQRTNDMTCVVDIKKQMKHTIEYQVYIFLIGLYHSLGQVNDWVLAISHLQV